MPPRWIRIAADSKSGESAIELTGDPAAVEIQGERGEQLKPTDRVIEKLTAPVQGYYATHNKWRPPHSASRLR